MAPFSRGRSVSCLCRPNPAERLFAIDEPLRWEDGGALKRLCTRLRKTCWHQECELANTRRPVPRNDVRIAPLHDAGTERVSELSRVDEEALRAGLLRFPDEEAERRHEATIRHGRGRCMPPKLEQILVVDNHAPLVVNQFRRWRHSCLLEDRLTIWYKQLMIYAPSRSTGGQRVCQNLLDGQAGNKYS